MLLLGWKIIELYNVAYALAYDLNFTSLSQLCKNGILFYNDLIMITLMRKRKIITHVKRK